VAVAAAQLRAGAQPLGRGERDHRAVVSAQFLLGKEDFEAFLQACGFERLP
jgi:hypothetical protein